jgi:hypothetical protein
MNKKQQKYKYSNKIMFIYQHPIYVSFIISCHFYIRSCCFQVPRVPGSAAHNKVYIRDTLPLDPKVMINIYRCVK